MDEHPTWKARIEALLFASDRPLSPAAILAVLSDDSDLTPEAVISAMGEIQQEYERRQGGFHLVEVAGGYEFRTRDAFAHDILRLTQRRPTRLSQAAMETLAIIAYRQPCTKALVDQLRAVDSGAAIRTLIQRELVSSAGRSKQPGHPYLYQTTADFLRVFGLASLADLPDPSELDGRTEGQVLLLADYRKQVDSRPTPGNDDPPREKR